MDFQIIYGGWGIEDRALYYRCYIKNINITNNPNKTFKYFIINLIVKIYW